MINSHYRNIKKLIQYVHVLISYLKDSNNCNCIRENLHIQNVVFLIEELFDVILDEEHKTELNGLLLGKCIKSSSNNDFERECNKLGNKND